MSKRFRSVPGLVALMAATTLSGQAMAQKSGQSISIQYGIVVGSTYVQEKSEAGKGALVGGAIGYYSARDKSSSTKVASTAIGAGLGGGAKRRSQGSLEARQYEVNTGNGIVVIISDQTEIHVDDCVQIENPGTQNANIRRVDAAFCDTGSEQLRSDLADEMQEDAQDCAAAKAELQAAQNDDAFNLALQKVRILCDT